METAVNIQRLCNASEVIFSKYHENNRNIEHRDGVRLRAYIQKLRELSEEARVDHNEQFVDKEELAIVSQKIGLFENLLIENNELTTTLIRRKSSDGKSVDTKTNVTNPPEEIEAIDCASSVNCDVFDQEASKESISLENIKPQSIFDGSEMFSRFMNTASNYGQKSMDEQLKQNRHEAEVVKQELADMVSRLKDSVTSINDKIQLDAKKLDVVDKEFEGNLNFLFRISDKLDHSLKSTSISWKSYLTLLVFVVITWFLTYLVMRLFPKSKTLSQNLM